MSRLLIVLALAAAGYVSRERAVAGLASFVPSGRIIDATHLHRRSADEIEIIIVREASGGGLLIFHLNRQPIAKLDAGEMIRLYLSPGRYRFGVMPESHVALYA